MPSYPSLRSGTSSASPVVQIWPWLLLFNTYPGFLSCSSLRPALRLILISLGYFARGAIFRFCPGLRFSISRLTSNVSRLVLLYPFATLGYFVSLAFLRVHCGAKLALAFAPPHAFSLNPVRIRLDSSPDPNGLGSISLLTYYAPALTHYAHRSGRQPSAIPVRGPCGRSPTPATHPGLKNPYAGSQAPQAAGTMDPPPSR